MALCLLISTLTANACFPHYNDQHDICGLELKDEKKSIFVKGSEKRFWVSNYIAGDDTLIIAESVVDAISHSILFPNQTAVYAATGGGVSPELASYSRLR